MIKQFLRAVILAGLVGINMPLHAQILGTGKKSAIAPTINESVTNNLTNGLSLPIERSVSPTINLQDRSSNLNPGISVRPASPKVTASSEKTEVILENRSSGCRAIAGQTINLQPNLCPKPNIPIIAKASLNSNLGNNDKMLYPLPYPAAVTSGFGWRVHPITGKSTFHQGIDLGAAEGTPVYAVYNGTIEVADWMGGLGKAVVISHGYGSETRYGHLSQILVQPGQVVKQGTVIGLVGSTGMSTGAHLHFELWQRNTGEWNITDATNAIAIAMDSLQRLSGR
jgi:murein DD-endopeptidase MepM/ murein hydrolase activator NlpD